MSGRIRSIKPEILEDEVATGLSDRAWRLWVSSWLLADDHGNLRAHDKYLAANVWQDTSAPVEDAREELIATNRWVPYAVRGQRYVHIRSWEKHQRVDNRARPRVPEPTEDDGTWDQGVASDSLQSRRESPRVSAERVAAYENHSDQPPTRGAPETLDCTPPTGLRALAAESQQARGDSSGAPRARVRASRPPTTDHRPPTTEGVRGSPDPGASPAPPESDASPPPPPAVRSKIPKASRIPPDWTPGPDFEAWARAEGIRRPLEPLAEFRDYWLSVAGPKGAKADWTATYRNWLRRLVADGRLEQRKPPPAPVTPVPIANGKPDRAMTAAERAALLAQVPEMFRDVIGEIPDGEP